MAEPASLRDILAATPLFGSLEAEALDACVASFRPVKFAAGQILFARGDAGDRLYVVEQGRVRLAIATEEGRELSVRHAVPGDLLGEIAVLDGSSRSAEAVAITPVVAHALGRSALLQLIARHPPIALGVIGLLCRRLRETTEQLKGIALFSVEVRLARFLLTSLGGRRAAPGKRVPLDLTISQSELAQLLGASRPKVNGALGALEKSGAVKRTADRLYCDPDLLAAAIGRADA
jgi:CRP-like cAMP-binding protein